MPVKEAAKLLGVGRPALSNLLNGKAALSPEMASRLEKAFGADMRELLKLQVEFDQRQQQSIGPKLVVGAYVPSFLKVTATDIEHWADGNIGARSLLPVLLRKLVNSTGQDLSLVDFPGYDQAEQKGWDGRVDAAAASPWIPMGQSGWEFGCNQDPKRKADDDYAARVKAIRSAERLQIHFVFVTPRKWSGKEKWRKEKEAFGDWKSVRAYDASNIEQWLEQSLQAQGWLSEEMGRPADGVHSLEEQWRTWATVTDPELSRELFAPSVEHFKKTFETWIENPPSSPLIVCGDSKLEAMAFLYCMCESEEPAFKNFNDRFLVFSSASALRKLTTASPAFIPIVFTNDVECELGGIFKHRHSVIVRPRNKAQPRPDIVLDILGHDAFKIALEAMGFKDHLEIDDLARQSGYSPTILRRRLAKVPAISTPEWARDSFVARSLIPMMLVGAWDTQSKGDIGIMSVLAGKRSDEIEINVAKLLEYEDPPIWCVGTFRGVSSKIDAFFAVQTAVTQKDLDEFFRAAEIVLSEQDPALELPEDKRAFSNIYGKFRDHSGALRDGICETLVLLAVHGNDLFAKRLGINLITQVDMLIRRLLTPLAPEKLRSQTDNLPLYAEAAPQEFLRIIEDDLRSANPQVYTLMKPADTGFFGSCPRTGLLWALENLAWKADQFPRVSLILAKLAERKINDNWVNKPEHSLQAIFRSWMPQTAAPLEDRKKTLEVLTRKFPAIAWKICIAQFPRGHQIGEYSHRPRWRNDASGAGQPISTRPEIVEFNRKALDLALAWPSHDESTLGDIVENLQGLPEEDQKTVWKLVQRWAATETGEGRKATLRERIRRFAFVRRSPKQSLTAEIKDLARNAYALLTPTDLIIRSQWLFEQPWVEPSLDELEEPEIDYQKRDEKIRQLRIAALQEIWRAQGFEGIKALLSKSGAASTIGWHLAEGVIASTGAADFVKQCLRVEDQNLAARFDQAIGAFLLTLDAPTRLDVTQGLAKVLPSPLLCRLLKHSPFQHDTWEYVDAQAEEVRKEYWSEVHPHHLRRDSPDLNEVVDRLREAKRPRAASFAVQFALEQVETSRLKRLLQEIGTCDAEAPGTYRVDKHDLTEALGILQNRAGVSEEDMARLEFLFIAALESLDQPIPNLEKQVGKSPALFVQALAMIHPRDDGGKDPPEWEVKDASRKSGIGTAAYRLMENVKRIPGADDAGKISEDKLRAWIKEAQALCVEYGRADIGEQKIGQIMSAAPIGKDGIWPCEEIRNVLEECGTPKMKIGIQIGVYNLRGAYARAEGGEQERALAERYGNWSRVLAFEYPYVASLVEAIAEKYDHEALMWDSDAAVRRRLRR
jgi:hypothetical protein